MFIHDPLTINIATQRNANQCKDSVKIFLEKSFMEKTALI